MEDEGEVSEVSSVSTSEDEIIITRETKEKAPKKKIIDENLEEEDEDDDEDDAQSDAGDDELYEIEKIVGHKKEGGQMKYKVRWKGYDPSQDSWEPDKSLLEQGCDEIIEAYWEEVKMDEETREEELERKRREEEEILEKRRAESRKWGGILESVSDEMDEVSKKEILNLYVADRVMTETEKALIKVNTPAGPASAVRLTRAQLRKLNEENQENRGSSGTPVRSESQESAAEPSTSSQSAKKRSSTKMAGTGKKPALLDSSLSAEFITAGDSSSDESGPSRKRQKRAESSTDSTSSETARPGKKAGKKSRLSTSDAKKIVKRRESEAKHQRMVEDLKRASIRAKIQSEERAKKTLSALDKIKADREARRQKEAQNGSQNGEPSSKARLMIRKHLPTRAVPAEPVSLLDSILDQQAATVSGAAYGTPVNPNLLPVRPAPLPGPTTAPGVTVTPKRPSVSIHKPSTVLSQPRAIQERRESADANPQFDRITSIREGEKRRISRELLIADSTPATRRRLVEDLPNVIQTVSANEAMARQDEYYASHEPPRRMTQEQFIQEIKQRNVSNVARAFREASNAFDLDYADNNGDHLLHMIVGMDSGSDSSHAADDLIRLLADNGADLFSKNAKGFTALHLAVKLNKTSNVRRLIGAGSPINLTDCNGRNALDIALDHNVGMEIVKELLYAGANLSHRSTVKVKAKGKDIKSSLVAKVESHLLSIQALAHEKRRIVLRDIKILDHSVSPVFTTSLCDPEENTYSFDIPSDMAEDNHGFLVTCMVVDSAPIFDSTSDGASPKYYARLWGWSPIKDVVVNGDNCQAVTESGSHHFMFATNLLRRNILRIHLKEEYRRRPLFVVTQVIKIELSPDVVLLIPENNEDEEFVERAS